MDSSAPNNQKLKVLITHATSYLGEKLASYLISLNCQVYGVAKTKIHHDLVTDPNFTLLDLNLNQPIPTHIAQFDLIVHLTSEQKFHHQASKQISTQTANIIQTAFSQNIKLAIIAPLATDSQIYESQIQNTNASLILVGDIYGPQMHHTSSHTQTDSDPFSQNLLTSMIYEAATEDKLILEKEGQEIVYPTYIDDALEAISKLVFQEQHKQIHYIVSGHANSTLEIGYAIQNCLQNIAAKDLKLYFSGSEPQHVEPSPSLKIPESSFDTKTDLEKGLEAVFKDLQENGHIKNAQNKSIDHTTETSHSQHQPHTNTQKAPIFSGRRKSHSALAKKVLLFLFVIIILIVAKSVLDITLGIKNLKSTQEFLKKGDFDKSATSAQSAAKHLSSAQSQINFLSAPYTLIFTKKTGISNVLDTAVAVSQSISDIAQGAKILSANLAQIAQTDTKKDTPSIEEAQTSFQKAYFESSFAASSAQLTQSSKLIGKYTKSKIVTIQNLNKLAQNTYEFSQLIKDITGQKDPKTYLILLTNNTELRPGGGFIGNYGTISFADGHLREVKVSDIYQIDGQLKEKIEPPKELKDKLGVDNFYLRDSNWSADFQINAKTARDFYKKETGQSVDGVISIDLYFIQNILRVTGPLKLTDYKEEISADNLFERGEYYAEIGFFPGSTQKKDFFASLTNALISKLTDNLTQQKKDNFSLVSIAQSIGSSLSQKHLMLSLDSQNLATYTKSKGWDNPLPPLNFDPANDSYETRDFLSISEANVGANKVNESLDRKIDYDLTVGRDADLVAKLKITYTNKSQANTWPGGTYVNFLRLYVPLGATPFEVKNNDKTDLKDVQVTNQNNLTILSTFVEVPIKSTREFTLTYRIPKNIQLEKAPTYHVYLQKQPGTDRDFLNFTFNLPNYLAVKSVNSSESQQDKQNISIQSDLQEDRQFAINIVKK